MIIRQRVDPKRVGNLVSVDRILRVENRLYVDVWQTLDATEKTLMLAVNKAVEAFVRRCRNRRGYGEEGTETI